MSCLEEGNLLKSCVVSAYGFIIIEGKGSTLRGCNGKVSLYHFLSPDPKKI